MDHHRVKHYVSIAGIVSLAGFGVAYLMYSQDPQPTVILSIVAGIAGLGGYNLKQRQDTKS